MADFSAGNLQGLQTFATGLPETHTHPKTNTHKQGNRGPEGSQDQNKTQYTDTSGEGRLARAAKP